MFGDEVWIRQAKPEKLVELARDIVPLASVLNSESIYRKVLATVLQCILGRIPTRDLEVVAAAPLVAWTNEVQDVLPWIEAATLEVLDGWDKAAFSRVSKNIREGKYRSLTRQPRVEHHQLWQTYVRDRRNS